MYGHQKHSTSYTRLKEGLEHIPPLEWASIKTQDTRGVQTMIRMGLRKWTTMFPEWKPDCGNCTSKKAHNLEITRPQPTTCLRIRPLKILAIDHNLP